MPEIGDFNTNFSCDILNRFIIIWFILYRTTNGYEWRISGKKQPFCTPWRVEIEKNYMHVMLLTGALAGLAGGLIIMAGPHRFIKDWEPITLGMELWFLWSPITVLSQH
jgi:simple sugar transport system permease protein